MLTKEAAELGVAEFSDAVTSWSTFVAEHLRKHPEVRARLGDAAQAVKSNASPPHLRGSVLTQVHCHERTVGDHSDTTELFDAMGVREDTVSTGCCGLAGNWGFEPGHAELSFQLGERELFPRAREAEQVCADGFSCRTHVEQGTGTRPQHVAQLLAHVLTDR